tara:strand:- start:933 stop:1574 length:642 start_codon:yes stop_codon:yes gene_type:complete
MDEEITIINEKTRNEKIKSFFLENRNLLLSIISVLVILIISFFSYQAYKKGLRASISDKYNSTVIEYKDNNKSEVILKMKEIVLKKDSTYSPLALYFLIDNNLIDKKDANDLFDVLIEKTRLETEIKNLIIYKKALFNADTSNENELIDLLNPLINSNSIWKPHALYLAAEYFYSKNEKQKSKEFFNEILSLENPNQDLIQKAQKRLNRDLSE